MSAYYIERDGPHGHGTLQRSQFTKQIHPISSGGNGVVATSQVAAEAATDYRDDLRQLLDTAHSETGITRYRLCKQMGIDSGTLSNVLAKRRHFSLDKLAQILGLLGYRLAFLRDDELAAPGTAHHLVGAHRPERTTSTF